MAEDQDDSQKTEDPTQKRLEDAVKNGQIPKSREVTSFIMLLILAIMIIWMIPSIMKKAMLNLTGFIESPHSFVMDGNSLMIMAKHTFSDAFFLMIAPVFTLIAAIYISSIIQHPLILSWSAAAPKLERISPLSGLKRMFSLRSLVEFLKGILKITMVGVVAYLSIAPDLGLLKQLPGQTMIGMLLLMLKLSTKMMIGICSLMALIAVVDYLYQKFEYIKSLRMSKKDLKDEFKQTEGSPEVKAKLREIRNKRAGKNMMAKVPTADVVITNPTHYSVALKYDSAVTEAPVVVAKGKDLIALKIREIAKEHNIPIVENPPLARALFSSVELDQEIPVEHYNAVAEVIKYIYKLKGKMPKKRV